MNPFKKSFTKNSEGELKKRLNYHADNNDYFMVDIEKIEEILELAKKDLWEPIIKLELQPEKPNGLDYAYTYQKLINRIEKWFGETK